MQRISQIVCKAIVLAGGAALLAACGQKGPLHLPQEPAAANRATLPQTMDPRRNTPDTLPQPADAPAPGNQKQ